MKLILDAEIKEFDNNKAGIDKLLSLIEEKVFSYPNKLFSHLLIDGIEVYEGFSEYLEDNIKNVGEIQMVFFTIKEYIAGILTSTSEYLTRAIPALEELANSFYKEPDTTSWQQVDNLLEGISWLNETYNTIDNIPNLANVFTEYEKWNIYSKSLRELQEVMRNLEEPMESGDYVTVADIILYEIKRVLENIRINIPVVEL
ncbi:MAG: hypothetical protein GX333_01895 [Syntrophomonadaceae bacterium]|nr:hypothetical protein [Syntrophomonadaceae bacterium]